MLLTAWRHGFRLMPVWRWLIGLALLSGALVAHGCHRDDVDHELCAPPGPVMRMTPQ